MKDRKPMAIHILKTYLLDSVYESIKFQLILDRFINNISLSDTEIDLLSVLYVHGVTDEALSIVEEKRLYKNSQSIKNAISKFSKMGIINKENGQKILTDKLNVKVSDKILMTIKIGNS